MFLYAASHSLRDTTSLISLRVFVLCFVFFCFVFVLCFPPPRVGPVFQELFSSAVVDL